jgi:hypothetical protein
LIEALALVHDIGHPPYGHSGEDALGECLRDQGGFSHNRFALTLVEELETRYTPYPGLNLSQEVLAGQDFRITHDGAAPLLEVQVVDLADSLAYNAHDVDDALALGLIQFQQLQGLELVQRALEWGQTSLNAPQPAIRQSLVHSLIDVQVADVLERSLEVLQELEGLDSLSVRQLETTLALSLPLASEREQLAQFLFDNVYRHDKLITVRKMAATRVRRLFERLLANPSMLPPRFVDRAQARWGPTGRRLLPGRYDRSLLRPAIQAAHRAWATDRGRLVGVSDCRIGNWRWCQHPPMQCGPTLRRRIPFSTPFPREMPSGFASKPCKSRNSTFLFFRRRETIGHRHYCFRTDSEKTSMSNPVPPQVLPYKLNWTYAITIVLVHVLGPARICSVSIFVDCLRGVCGLYPHIRSGNHHWLSSPVDAPQLQMS